MSQDKKLDAESGFEAHDPDTVQESGQPCVGCRKFGEPKGWAMKWDGLALEAADERSRARRKSAEMDMS
jgi:hypothetical protein